jgi:hypothetical protein
MDSILAEGLKKSNSPFIEYFNIWKSRLKPGKKHWIAAAAYFVAAILLSLGWTLAFGLLSYDIIRNMSGILMIAFPVLFYFFYFKYLKVKRLSDFLPIASVIGAVQFLLLAIGFLLVGSLASLPADMLFVLSTSIFLYLALAFEGMGAMALFLKKFEKSFFARCLLLALLAFIILPFARNALSDIFIGFAVLRPPLDYFYYALFPFLFHFTFSGTKEEKSVFAGFCIPICKIGS